MLLALLAAGAALITLGWMFGPRVRVRPRLREPEVPALPALELWLAGREASVPSLRPGCEKHIQWGGRAGERTPLVFAYFHGYSATRREISPVVETLALRFCANAYFARLHGHGRDQAAFRAALASDWLNDTIEAYRIAQRLGERVVLVATSTGATLAMWLALRAGADVAALVLLSPNFGPRDPRAEWMLAPWGTWLARVATRGYLRVPVRNDEHGHVWLTTQPVEAAVQMMALVQYVRREPLEQIRQPVLVLYSPRDATIDLEKMLAGVERIGSPRKHLVDMTAEGRPEPGHPHVVAGDILSPQSTEIAVTEIERFLRDQVGLA